jgi:hypothetical protein
MRFSFDFAFDRADYDLAVKALDALGAVIPPRVTPPAATAAPEDWGIDKWWEHLGGGNSRSFWTEAARHLQTHRSFTFDELAAATGIDKQSLRSYHRNSYRAINDESAPDPLGGEWDANQGCNVYTMVDVVRDEILRLSALVTA